VDGVFRQGHPNPFPALAPLSADEESSLLRLAVACRFRPVPPFIFDDAPLPRVNRMDKTLFQKMIDREIPAEIVYEDDRYIVIHDISPQAPVHVLVIPKKLIPTLNDVQQADAELIGGMFVVARQVMGDLGHTDYRTVFNCGRGAQQSVFHIHLHVLAGRPFVWPPG
jgi:histidine triad (HIT) family protein